MQKRFSIGILLFMALLIFYGTREYIYYREAMKLAKQTEVMQNEVNSFLATELDEALYSRYNDNLVPGTSIKTASDSFLKSDGFRLEVKSMADGQYEVYTSDNPYSPDSVNEDAYFKATLIKENEKVIGIKFDQSQ